MTKTWLGLSIVVGLVFMLAVPAWAELQAGFEAYERGDFDTALKAWRPLAEQGEAAAQWIMGTMYENGQGVPQDYTEAAKWYRLAAEQGDGWGQNNLGVMYAQGRGVPQDYQEAARWNRKAAEQGLAIAQGKLGVMYALSQGVPKDYVLAHMWLNLAEAKGVKEAAKLRDTIEQHMTPVQLATAQRLAREWKPKGE